MLGRSWRPHVPESFPHYRTDGPDMGACMCLQPCCQGKWGCICTGCRAKNHSHSKEGRKK